MARPMPLLAPVTAAMRVGLRRDVERGMEGCCCNCRVNRLRYLGQVKGVKGEKSKVETGGTVIKLVMAS